MQNTQAEKATQKKLKASSLEDELKYEQEFWKTNTGPVVLGRVATPNGGIVTGRLLFIPECPKGHWCVQPDTLVTDENGNDIADEAQPDPPPMF